MASGRLLLRGGLVADGIGVVAEHRDVLIDGPLITAADLRGETPADCDVIDLPAGSVICPGFIDAHVHAEGPLLATGRVEGALAQGVTTLVIGQDGQSWVGSSPATATYLNTYFGPVNGRLEPAAGLSVASFREAVAGRLSQNVAVLASQGTIRHNVAGLAQRPLTPEERRAARRELEESLADGAVGLSSGLDYLPSRFGSAAETADIARPLAAAGRPYVSHLRGYGADVGAGLAELVAVGREAGVRVHASHLWGPPPAIRAAFQAADSAGVPVSYDMYPYRRSSTILASLLLPAELQAGGTDATLAALADPQRRAGLLSLEKFSGRYLAGLYLGSLPAGQAGLAGLPVTEAARRSGRPPGDWVLDLLVTCGLQVGAHLDRPALTGEHLDWLVTSDRHCAGSDGIYQGQHPHPRGWAAFADLAARYLAAAPGPAGYQVLARHLAVNAADAYGLADRGRLAPGMAADICVISTGGLTARATYDAPAMLADGVHLVLVNGEVTWRDGAPVTAASPGRLVS